MTEDSSFVVLLVDDQPIIGESIRQILVPEEGISFHYCSDPRQALGTAIAVSPTVILVDLVMPGMSGLELVPQFRGHDATRHVPLIVLSMKDDPQIKAEAFRVGANDYLVKLPSAVELVARLRYHSRAYLNASRSRAAFEALRESREQLRLSTDEIRRQRDTLSRQARELTEKNAELADANTVKTYFAATMSHELRNVFAAMVGYSELLADKLGSGEEFSEEDAEMMQQLNRRGQEGLDIITVTLELSRSEITGVAHDFQPVDLPEMLGELTAELPPLHRKENVAVRYELEQGLKPIHSDPIKLRMILSNLLTNALKFSLAGGEIVVRARNAGDDLELTVSDTGVGIAPEQLPTLFDPFRQAHGMRSRRAGGAGLGLYVVRRLVEMLDGTIEVSSEVGKGSVFRVLLRGALRRVGAPNHAADPDPGSPESGKPQRSLDVLAVEDTPEEQKP